MARKHVPVSGRLPDPDSTIAGSFGPLLRYFLKEREMKQQPLLDRLSAQGIEIHRRQTITDWLNGTYRPEPPTVRALARILALSPHQEHLLLSASYLPSEEVASDFVPRNPYKGLRPFTLADQHDFFGRAALIKSLLACFLQDHPASDARLLTVTGPSGSGKTSVIQAGLLPALQNHPLTKAWLTLPPIVPGKSPFLALGQRLADHHPQMGSAQDIAHRLEHTPGALDAELETILPNPQERIVLIIDQAEEVFTQGTDEHTRARFLDLLAGACRSLEGKAWIVLVFRADFERRFQHHPELGPLLLQHTQLVEPLTPGELREVIEGPAQLPDVRLRFEPHLVDTILHDLQGQPESLPLLQFTMDQLFHTCRQEHYITAQAYHALGGVPMALANHADAIYRQLPTQQHRDLVPALFMRLMILDADATSAHRIVRRRAALHEFDCPSAQDSRHFEEIIATFIAQRLLTPTESGEQLSLEVSHEAFLHTWSVCTHLIQQQSQDIRLLRDLSRDVATGQRDLPGKQRYRGHQLKEARLLAKRYPLSTRETTFLQTSSRRQRQDWIVGTCLFLLALIVTASASFLLSRPPDPTLVTTLSDAGSGSLRQALQTAPDKSVITFGPGLQGSLRVHKPLIIAKQLTLQFPPDAAIQLISADHTTLFRIAVQGRVTLSHLVLAQATADQSLISNQGTLHLDFCQITGNVVSNHVDQNGIIVGDPGTLFNTGTLTVTNSLIADNALTAPQDTGNGGGIYNLGNLTLLASTLRHNSASASGGGIYNGQTLTITDSTITDNHSLAPASFSSGGENPFGGGGVYNLGTATINTTTLSGNTAAGDGGAIYNAGTLPHIAHMGELMLTTTTLTTNQTSGRGGAVFNAAGGALSLMNTTFFRNHATSGGALFNFADANITASTIVANSASHNGGGLAHLQPDPARLGSAASSNQLVLQIGGSLLTDNQAPSDAEIALTQESLPSFHSEGFNLVRVPASFVPATTDRRVDQHTALHLASQLAGPAPQTLDLRGGSPALDLIPPSACLRLKMSIDEHGRHRPIGPGCEPGASEYQPASGPPQAG